MGDYGTRIKAAREAAGITQEQLGKETGVTGVTIMRYEKDQREPSQMMLKKIAAALNVDVLDLLGLTPEEREEGQSILDNAAWEELHEALLASDGATVQTFDHIQEKVIDAHLYSIISDELNRAGKILTLKRAYELSLMKQFSRWG